MQAGDAPLNATTETAPPIRRSRWDRLVWPQWLPIRARLPLIAQIAGAFALMAAVTMPQWSDVSPPPPVAATAPAAVETPVLAAPVADVAPAAPARPAHLNLDLRHNFRSVDVTVSVDNKRVLDEKLDGAGKRFGVFGKRGERSFTRSLDLQPGVRVVRLRVRSEADKFDHTRVERFELGSSAVAAMRITVDRSGLDVMTDRPPAPAPPPAAASVAAAAPAAASPAAPPVTTANVPEGSQTAAFLGGLYQTTRNVLIGIAGFIASVASAFVFEEYLRSRNLPFIPQGSSPSPDRPGRPERRRRVRRPRDESDISIDAGLS